MAGYPITCWNRFLKISVIVLLISSSPWEELQYYSYMMRKQRSALWIRSCEHWSIKQYKLATICFCAQIFDKSDLVLMFSFPVLTGALQITGDYLFLRAQVSQMLLESPLPILGRRLLSSMPCLRRRNSLPVWSTYIVHALNMVWSPARSAGYLPLNFVWTNAMRTFSLPSWEQQHLICSWGCWGR